MLIGGNPGKGGELARHSVEGGEEIGAASHGSFDSRGPGSFGSIGINNLLLSSNGKSKAVELILRNI
jgi:hypothetical protein